jgi:putative colanic acid biosynthesis glycosyltransferase
MLSPLVSIIIPVYNARSTLAKTLISVINQQYPAKEILVIDGGSTDGSLDVINQFRAQIQFFISESDSGVYQAINKGLNKAKGSWILILGADDYLSETDVLTTCLQDTPQDCELILGDVINFGTEHSFVPQTYHNAMSRTLYWKNTIHQQGVFYHRRVFDHFRFNESYKVLADYDLHLMLLKIGVKWYSVDKVIAHCSAGGLSKQFKTALYREELKIKRSRLSPWIFMLNIPWVWIKYVIKKLG